MKQQLLKEHLQMYGASTLSTAELLAYLLASGPLPKDPLVVARQLLDTYGLKRLTNATCAELSNDAGLSQTQAQQLTVVCELAQRFALGEPGEQKRIASCNDAFLILSPLMRYLEHEEFRVLVLDTKNHVVANVLLYRGTVNSSCLRTAEIFRQAIVRNCANVIVAHNHPSSDPSPSPEDIEVTKQLVEAGKLLDIDLMDHLIIGNPRYVSLKERMRW